MILDAPHTLEKQAITSPDKDEFGREITGTGEASWVKVGCCRCDDNTTSKFEGENGQLYIPAYHIVCEMDVPIKAGDRIRCLHGDVIKCEGEVRRVKKLNFLNYSEIWV